MHEYTPVYSHHITKNKPATVGFILSLVSIIFMILIIPSLIVGGIFVSMAGQSPQASGVDPDNPEAMVEYNRESARLAATGMVFFFITPILSGVTAVPGLILGIIGVRKPYKRGHAIAGIVMSAIPLFIGMALLLAFL